MNAPPAVSEARDVCTSDPNFAVIFAFCERFGDSCGVVIPTFQELQEMLEKTNEVPDALVDLHVKLLRRVKKSVHTDKWEKAILKFCQGYAIPEFWELERYGYKGISVPLKLKILKALFEAQFDSNVKFKAEINKLESSTLRSQPLGWDKSGVAYWVQFDRACNLRVYKEDIDEDTWKIVAKDRNTLVNLINELSGEKNNSLEDIDESNSIETSSDAEVELSGSLDQEKHFPTNPNAAFLVENNERECSINESCIKSEKNFFDRKEDVETPINLKRKSNENLYVDDCLHNKHNFPIVGDTIEESVMIVKGEGSGEECDTGNPDEINSQSENVKNEDVKKPKLWSIETICSSSKEVQEEIISVPKTGFFFGDDSVPCLNNVSHGEERSNINEENLEINSSLEDSGELKKNKEFDSSSVSLNSVKSLNEELSTKSEEFSDQKHLKQSVFNIKIHEEEVQITERNVNEVFSKSNSCVHDFTHKTDICETTITNLHSESQETQLDITHNFETNEDNVMHTTYNDGTDKCDAKDTVCQKKIEENKINDVNKIIDCEIVKDNPSDNCPSDQLNNLVMDVDKQTIEQENLSVESKNDKENETEKELESDQQSKIKTVDQTVKTDKHIFENDLKINMALTNEVGKIGSSCEGIKANKSIANEVYTFTDIKKPQSVEIVGLNPRKLDITVASNVIDPPSILNDNEIMSNYLTIPINQCNEEIKQDNMEVVYSDIKPNIEENLNKSIEEKQPLLNTKILEDFFHENKWDWEQFKRDYENHKNLSINKSSASIEAPMVIDEMQSSCGIAAIPLNQCNEEKKHNNTKMISPADMQLLAEEYHKKYVKGRKQLEPNTENRAAFFNEVKLSLDRMKMEIQNFYKNKSSAAVEGPMVIDEMQSSCEIAAIPINQCNDEIKHDNIEVVYSDIKPNIEENLKKSIEEKRSLLNAKSEEDIFHENKLDWEQLKRDYENHKNLSINKSSASIEAPMVIDEMQSSCEIAAIPINQCNEEKKHNNTKMISPADIQLMAEEYHKKYVKGRKRLELNTENRAAFFNEAKLDLDRMKMEIQNFYKNKSSAAIEAPIGIDEMQSSCEIAAIPINQCNQEIKHNNIEVVYSDIKPNVEENLKKSIEEKRSLLNAKSEEDIFHENKLDIDQLKRDFHNNLSINKSSAAIEAPIGIDEMQSSCEIAAIPINQCNEEIKHDNIDVVYSDIKPNVEENLKKSIEGKKRLLLNTKNIDAIFRENKLDLDQLKRDFHNNLSINKSSAAIEAPLVIDNENNDSILQDDEKMIAKSIKNDENLENKEEVNSYEDTKNQQFKKIDRKKEVQTVPSLVDKDICENADETNEETFIDRSKEGFDVNEENDRKSEDEIEETPKKKGRPGRKKGKRGRAKKSTTIKQDSKVYKEEKVKRPYKPRQKKVVTIAEEVTVFPDPAGDDSVRRSRRIAEIKIKEQFVPNTLYDDIDIPLKVSKKKDKNGKKNSTPTKKAANTEESDDDDEEDPISKKFKKRKKKGKMTDSLKKLNMKNPWNVDSESSSSENNIGLFEDYDHEEEDEVLRPGIEPNVSDHEFSPESDINDDDEEYLPEKRARTAHKKDQSEQLKDDMSCQNCKKSDQPDWILLCDTCNQGWHASCLRPPLMVIPDGDWYCPPCRHESLLNALKDTLKKYDSESKKRENEELRRKRLAYVGISLQNVITSKTEEVKTEKKLVVNESSEDDEEESESESYDSEPLYQLRARRQANVSYRFNDYDNMINEAILETGVDESIMRKSVDVKTDKNDNDEKTDSDENDRGDSPIAPALLHLRGRKKSKKLTNLDISSDDGSDEDFKGPSDDDDDYEEDVSEYSDDFIQKRPQPTRRSVRNRKNVVDPDFINDDSSEDSTQKSKKKKSRPWSDTSNSEEEDFTWGKKKKKQRTNAPSSSSLSFRQSKGSKRKFNKTSSSRKHKNSKIKYGMDSNSDSDGQPKRRTRGRQITYAESDDSEEEVHTKKRKVISDDEDEYVLNDEELETENDDRNLEVDDDDAASNEEKDDDDGTGVDEEEDEEEEEVVDDGDEEAETKDDLESSITQKMNAVTLSTTGVQSVVSAHTTSVALAKSTDSPVLPKNFTRNPVHNDVHQRLLPQTEDPLAVKQTQLTSTTPDKRDRSPHQPKKSLSPNSSPLDYGGSYPYPLGVTKVVQSATVPPLNVPYNRPPSHGEAGVAAEGSLAVGGEFKPMTVVSTSSPRIGGFNAAPYRTANKITTTVPVQPTYLPPQPLRVYQATPPPPAANYTSYPIDYATASAPLPPPPPTIAFRNVVAPSSHEPHLPVLTQHQQTAGSMVVGGDSEFGGLVSYFSSQQEDDFDT